MRSRFVSVLLAALLLVACSKDTDLTVVAATANLLDRPDPAGATVGTTVLGARFKGKRSKKGWWKIALSDGKEGFAPPASFAPYPIAGQPRWVVAPFAGQFAEADLASRKLTAKYEIGTKLDVVGGAPWLPPEIAAVVGSGTVIGFVSVRTLGDREPKAADLLGAAREALLEGKTDQALMQGRRALTLDPRHAGARSLVAALHAANGDPEAESMQDALVVPDMAPPAVTVKAGEDAFIAVASVELREAKGKTTAVLTRLPVNTPVTVRKLDGEWAQIAWVGQPDVGRHIDIDPFFVNTAKIAPKPSPAATDAAVATATPAAAATATAAATPVPEEVVADGETTIGWVLAGYLTAAQQSSDALAVVARQRVAEGKLPAAVDLFDSAVTLAPANLELTRELLAAAVKADRYLAAAYAALALSRGGDLGGLEVVTMDLLYGCRGDRWKAEMESGATAPEADDELTENACVYDVSSEPPCAPCDYEGDYEGDYHDHDDMHEEDGGDAGPVETPEISAEEMERRRQIEEAEAAAAEAQEAVARAERDAAAQKASAEHDVEVADHALYLTKIDTAYPGGYWVYLEIRNRQAGRIAGAKIQLYQVPVGVEYNGESLPHLAELDVVEVELPPMGPQTSVGLWIPVSAYSGVEYGIVRMASLEAAEEALRNGLDPQSQQGMPPHHSVSVLPQDCSCGGC